MSTMVLARFADFNPPLGGPDDGRRNEAMTIE
jgi:hypothetical protein